MKKEKSCGTIVVNKKKQILLVRHNKGHYGFPKGHMEKNEDEIMTATRETKEETNVDVIIDDKNRYEISYKVHPGIEKKVVFFIAHPINDNTIPQIGEIKEVIWVDIDNVRNYLQFENIINLWDNQIIKDIKKQV